MVLAVEKRITSPLMVSNSVEKIFELDSHIACAVSGLTADAKMLVDHARVEAQHHTFVFNEKIRTESLTQKICDLALQFGESMSEKQALMVSILEMIILIHRVGLSVLHCLLQDPMILVHNCTKHPLLFTV